MRITDDHINSAQDNISKLNTFLMMLKFTSLELGEHPEKTPQVDLIYVTEMLIDLMKSISADVTNIEIYFNRKKYLENMEVK